MSVLTVKATPATLLHSKWYSLAGCVMSEASSLTQSDDVGGVYDRCDAAYLRQLHEASGMDETQLARIACLSVAQVRQLIAGGDSLFYSTAVKRQAYKRLLLILGAPPPSQVQDGVVVHHDATPPRQTIDDIVALSERHQYLEHRPVVDFLRDLRLRIVQHRQPLAALAMLCAAVVLLVLNWPLADESLAHVESVEHQAAKTSSTKPDAAKGEAPAAAKSSDASLASSSSSSSGSSAAPVSESASAATSAPVAAAAAVASTVVSALTPTPAPIAVTATKACAYRSDKLPEVVPSVATKEARYVYLVSPVVTDVCVVDGARQATLVNLRPGEGRSVYGTPPWQVSGAELSKLQIFFQGWRVALPQESALGITLSEKPH